MKKQLIAAIQARVEHLRTEDERTQAELAESIGLTQPRLNALLHGEVERFSLDALIALAAKLGLSVRLSVTRPYRSR
jgi:predicted XRE-type DNA-binding protein